MRAIFFYIAQCISLSGIFAPFPKSALRLSPFLMANDVSASNHFHPAGDHLTDPELFEKVFYHSPAAIAVTTTKPHVLLAANDGFMRLLQLEAPRAFGQSFEDLEVAITWDRHWKSGAEAFEDVADVLRDDHPVQWTEARLIYEDDHGQERVREVIGTYVPFVKDGERYVLHKIVNITPFRRLEKEVLEARDQEQERIARDLHDGLTGRLANLSALGDVVTAAADEGDMDKARTMAQRVAEVAQETVASARSVIQGQLPLRLAEQGLVGELQNLARRVSTTGDVTCTALLPDEELDLNDKVASHLFRIAQEAVTNALRHSGADHIELRLDAPSSAHEGELREGKLTITDDGTGLPASLQHAQSDGPAFEEQAPAEGGAGERPADGPDASTGGAGLRSMRYRTRLVHGEFTATTGEAGGARIQVTFPVEEAAPDLSARTPSLSPYEEE
jgi:signal transduction histidine kinase